jgi:transmembrane sensor
MSRVMPDDAEIERMAAAADWVVRLADSPEDESLVVAWLQWCDEDPQNLASFQSAQAIWHAGAASDAEDPRTTASGRRKHDGFKTLVRIAAVVIVAIGATLWVARRDVDPAPQSYATSVAGTGSSVLPDGSKVELGADSRITTHYSADHRSVSVDAGEAYFTVAKDPDRPFVVIAGDVRVTAVGTAFNVRRGVDRVVVAVSEGKVRIDGVEPVPVSAGHQAVYLASSQKVAVASIQPADTASWRSGVLKYVHEPLDSVVADLSRYSSRRIVVADRELGTLPFTGTVFSSDVEHAVHAFENVFPLQVIEREDSIELVPRR